MPRVYSYNFTSEGEGPWWGMRCSKQFYLEMIRGLEDATRCFVYLTNFEGESITVAVEGPHHEDIEDTIFVPSWVLEKLHLNDSDEVMMDSLSETLPNGTSVTVRPVTGSSVEGPIFLEGLTEALNQLGVIQEGRLFAVVDPSTNILHEFVIEDLVPEPVCLADGELTVNLERALDRPPSPEAEPLPEPLPNYSQRPDTPQPSSPFASIQPVVAPKPTGFVPFTGRSYRLDGKH